MNELLGTCLELELTVIAACILGEVTLIFPQLVVAIMMMIGFAAALQWILSFPSTSLTEEERREIFGDDEFKGL